MILFLLFLSVDERGSLVKLIQLYSPVVHSFILHLNSGTAAGHNTQQQKARIRKVLFAFFPHSNRIEVVKLGSSILPFFP